MTFGHCKHLNLLQLCWSYFYSNQWTEDHVFLGSISSVV